MTRFTFFGYWLFTAALAALALAAVGLFMPDWGAIMGLNWLGFGFFSLFCWLMFEISARSIQSENKQLFGQIFLLSIGLKMFATIILFILFMKKNPDFPRASVLSFMLIYAIFSIFEVFFMNRLAKQTKTLD